MGPDFENFRRRNLRENDPNIARSEAASKTGWFFMLMIVVFALCAIFGW